MRIGISICSNFKVEDPRLGARHMIERARAARGADLDSLFVGDHHVTSSPYYQNNAILGSLFAPWGNKPAGGLYLLPFWHPVLLAEQIGTLAAIAEGRFIMQCSLGGDPKQADGMGVNLKHRVSMFEDALNIMQALWRGECVTHKRYWNIKNARISPVPAESVEIWIGAMAPPAINRAARMAQGWLAAPHLNLSQALDQLNQYQQACTEHQRSPSATAIRRDIFIGATSQEADRVRQHYLDAGYRGFSADAMMVGSVSEVVDLMAEFGEVGYTDIIVRNMSADQGEALATIERLSDVKRQLESQ